MNDNINVDSGKWFKDENGREYRLIGATREYRTYIQTTSGLIPEDSIAEFNKINEANQKERFLKEQAEREAALTHRTCPFKVLNGGMDTDCKKDCALYVDDRCTLAGSKNAPKKDALNKYCPFCRNCFERCAMYENGCKLTSILSAEAREGK